MKEFTLGRSPTNVMTVAKLLPLPQTLNIIADSIVEKSPINVNNLAILLKLVQALLNTTEFILEKIQINAHCYKAFNNVHL